MHNSFCIAIFFFFTSCNSINSSNIEGNADNPRLLKNEIQQYKAALLKDTASAAIYNALAWSQLYGKEYEKAIRNFNLSLKFKKKANAYVGLGLAYDKMNHNQYAILSYQEALNLKPEWHYVLYQLGKLFAREKRKKDAMNMLDLLIASNKGLARELMDVLY
jgi:tetratricopeptide (TPR) repeat protein